MTNQYDWYGLVNDASLQQGDIFYALPIYHPSFDDSMVEASITDVDIKAFDVIVLSQSCDLEQGKIENVLVSPFWHIDQIENLSSELVSAGNKDRVRRGEMPGYHMLAACELEGFMSPIRVVSFRQVFSIPFEFIVSLAKQPTPRHRLLPPYREHLAQAFARFIMRVGLPVDIPPFR